MLLLGLLGLAALRRRVVHVLALLAIENSPHSLISGSEAGGDLEQLVGVDQRAPLELAHEVPTGHALEEGVHDVRLSNARELSTTLGKASYEILKRLARLLGAYPLVPGVPMAHVCTLEVSHKRADQVIPLWIWLGGKCSHHVWAESARCNGRSRMITALVVALPHWQARW
jgi:hypothetical protein